MEVKVSLARTKTGNLCSCSHTPYSNQKSDWAADENHSVGNNKGGGGRGGGVGPPTIRHVKQIGSDYHHSLPLGASTLNDDNDSQTILIPFALTVLSQHTHSDDQSIVTGIISLGGINPAMSTSHYTDRVLCLHPIWKGPSLTPTPDTRIYNRQQSPAFGQSCWSAMGRER
ncbi:hypothetical protein HNY73_001296 [Argiope bruennichi]|uniref:Uncharacterized protein n=1 Tax=Argiope bruennichi TaxID=94029 RepID=A0A8T0G0U9_ARGBR|nr:hypothetical protein HNY73_001296 [Argiope bruennichi]